MFNNSFYNTERPISSCLRPKYLRIHVLLGQRLVGAGETASWGSSGFKPSCLVLTIDELSAFYHLSN